MIRRWLESWDRRADLEKKLEISCPLEVDFKAMYPHLGNAKTLEKIRRNNPQPPEKRQLIHCKYLRSDANACNHRPVRGGKYEICKLNPYRPEAVAKRQEIEKENPKLADKQMEVYMENVGRELQMKIEMGLESLDRLTPMEYLLASFFWQERKAKELEVQAKIYGASVTRMFGGGE